MRSFSVDVVLFAKRALTLIATRFGSSILVLFYMTIFARSTTPEELGLATWCLSAAVLLSIALSLNVEAGSIRFLPAYKAAKLDSVAAAFVAFSYTVVSLMFGLICLCFIVFVISGGHKHFDVSPLIVGVMLATAFTVARARVTGRHAAAKDMVLRGSLPTSLGRPVLMCLLFGIFFLVDLRLTLDVFLIGLMIGVALGATVQAILVRSALPKTASLSIYKTMWREWRATGYAFLPVLLVRDNLRDVIVISAAIGLSAADLGLLGIAYSLFGLVYYSVKAVDISLGPRLAKALTEGRSSQVELYLATAAAAKITLVGIGVLILWYSGSDLLRVFGPDYIDAHHALVLLMIIPAADALFGAGYTVLNVKGQRQTVLFLALFSVCLIFCATAFAGSMYQLETAVVAAGCAYAFQQWLICRSSIRTAGVDPSAMSLVRAVRSHRHSNVT